MENRTNLIHLLGLAVGLEETAEELRQGGSREEAADYIEKVGGLLWAYVGQPGAKGRLTKAHDVCFNTAVCVNDQKEQ